MKSRLPDGTAVHTVRHPSGNLTILLPKGEPPAPTWEMAGTIRWYVPYTAVHEQTAAAAPKDAVWVDVSNGPIAYYAALRDIWARGETFAILEHDVVCTPEIVAEMEACPEPWCLCWYDSICHVGCREGWRNQLGCTRFRKELIAQASKAMDFPRDGWDWHEMCNGLGENLRALGFQHHWHGPVEHHRETHKL